MGVWSGSIHSFQQMCSQRGHSLLPLQKPLQQHSVMAYRPVKRHRTDYTCSYFKTVLAEWLNSRYWHLTQQAVSLNETVVPLNAPRPLQGPRSWDASGTHSHGGKVALTSRRISAGSWTMQGVRHRAASPRLVGSRSHRCCSDRPSLALAVLLLAVGMVQP